MNGLDEELVPVCPGFACRPVPGGERVPNLLGLTRCPRCNMARSSAVMRPARAPLETPKTPMPDEDSAPRAARPVVSPLCCGACGCKGLTDDGRGPCGRCGWVRAGSAP